MAKMLCVRDRISGFPDEILHHIMSFLPNKDTFRMSVLSKRWKHVIDTYPNLNFSHLDFGEDQCVIYLQPADLTKENDPKFWQILNNLINHVDQSMIRFSKNEFILQRFTLSIQLPDLKLASVLDKWVLLAIENGVKGLDLSVETPGFDLYGAVYSLPNTIFSATSLNDLRLSGCQLDDHFCIKWHALKKLVLEDSCMCDQFVRKLVTCCPLIEDMSLVECWGLKNVQIFGLFRLKEFYLSSDMRGPESIEIELPNLESCHIHFCLEEKRCTINVDACKGLKTLILVGAVITDQLFEHFDSKFPILESLSIRSCLTPKQVKISSQRLRDLVIELCDIIEDIEIDAPNLAVCMYYGFVAPTSFINAPSCKWTVDFVLKNSIDIPWYLKLKEFLAKLNNLVYLHLYNEAAEILFNVEDLDNNASPSLIEVLYLSVHSAYPISNYAAFMDGLFWCYHPKKLLIRSGSNNNIFVKYLSESLERGDLSCCNHGDARYWTHGLKDLKVDSCIQDVERYFPIDLITLDTFPKERSHACCKLGWQF